jgi:hypothetical protein
MEMPTITMAKKNNTTKNISDFMLSAHYTELMDIFAEIIAYDILKNMEKNDKEDSYV